MEALTRFFEMTGWVAVLLMPTSIFAVALIQLVLVKLVLRIPLNRMEVEGLNGIDEIAVMLGSLGTVLGLMSYFFFRKGHDTGQIYLAQALVTTFWGGGIAILIVVMRKLHAGLGRKEGNGDGQE